MKTIKLFLDTRFQLPESTSSNIVLELDTQIEIEDSTMYLDDVLIPLSYSIVDDLRNNILYFHVSYFDGINYMLDYKTISLESGNYNGQTLSREIENKMNDTLNEFMEFNYSVSYNFNSNEISFIVRDLRTTDHTFSVATVKIYSDYELLNSNEFNSTRFDRNLLKSINSILQISNKSLTQFTSLEKYKTYIDLVPLRNIYISSKTLSSINTYSNFQNNCIIKKIPVISPVGTMLSYGINNSFEGIHISKRSINRIDIQLLDSNNYHVNLNDSHFSFSLVFVEN